MRIRLHITVFIVVAASVTLSLLRGQEGLLPGMPPPAAIPPAVSTPAPVPVTQPVTKLPPMAPRTPVGTNPTAVPTATRTETPMANPTPAATASPAPAAVPAPMNGRDFSRLSKLQQQILLTAQRGTDWLFRMHGVKGRFLHGYLPALKKPLEGDDFYRQCGAARALARGGRLIGEERYAARASQALLALMEDTALDPVDSLSRVVSMPGSGINKLGAAGALVSAISELPAPQKDLLDRSEQLCRTIRKQARPDGSLACPSDEGDKDEGVDRYPGLALQALLLSHKHRPEPWKVELVRKALPYYRAVWKNGRSLELVGSQTTAFTEAYLVTKDKAFAEHVFEMGDWVCSLQYTTIDPRRMFWYGGFKGWRDGRAVETAPTIHSAIQAESLIEACRVAREMGDVTRFQRYSEAIERCLQLLATLQYTDAVTQHFADWFRPQVVGAFYLSHQDGNLRIDYTEHAVASLLGYLEHVAR